MIASLVKRNQFVNWPLPVRLAAATGLIGLAFVLGRWLGGPPFLFFYPAILAIAVMFDHQVSFPATLLAGALASAAIGDPGHGSSFERFRNLTALAVFLATGWAIGNVVNALRGAAADVSRSNSALRLADAAATAQRAMFDALLEGSGDVIYVKDAEGRFVHLNSAVAAVLGAPIDKIIGTRDRDYLAPEEADAIEAIDRQLMATGGAATIEEQVTTPGLPTRIYQSSKFAWKGPDGAVRGIIGISRDISAAKAAQDKLRAADAEKQLLLYDINHRVKNHLQTVGGLLGMASRRAATLQQARDALADGESRLAVLGRVYSRLQAGTEASVVDARGFIEELCADLKASLLDMRPIVLKVAAEAAPIESTRAVMLGLAINELVQNSIKYAFPDDRAGTIRVEFQRSGGEYRLSVGDDGVGLPHDQQPQGSGEGQRLIRAMAQQLGGSIVRTGHAGTLFVLVFPVTPDTATHM